MKAAMIQYQAEQTGQAVAKHIRPTLWFIQVLLVLLLILAYGKH